MTRNTWIKNIAEKGWAILVRARLTLRDRLGRDPSVDEVNDEARRVEGEVEQAKKFVKRASERLNQRLDRRATQKEVKDDPEVQRAKEGVKDAQVIPVERIARALREGEEFILIWEMKCIDYDTIFQHRLVTESGTWSKKDSSPSRSQASARKPNTKKSISTKLSKKQTSSSPRKRKTRDDDDDEDDDEDYVPSLSRADQLEVLQRPKRAKRNCVA